MSLTPNRIIERLVQDTVASTSAAKSFRVEAENFNNPAKSNGLASIEFFGSWRKPTDSSLASGDAYMTTTVDGDYAICKFRGVGISVRMFGGADRVFSVELDDRPAVDVSLSSSSGWISPCTYSGLENIDHTIKLTKKSGAYFSIDCFDVSAPSSILIDNQDFEDKPVIDITPDIRTYSYDFADKIKDNFTTNRNVSKYTSKLTVQVPASVDFGELVNGYSDLRSKDGIAVGPTISTADAGKYTQILSSFDLSNISSDNLTIKNNLKELKLDWYGYGQGRASGVDDWRASLKVWNTRTSAYEDIGDAGVYFSRGSNAYRETRLSGDFISTAVKTIRVEAEKTNYTPGVSITYGNLAGVAPAWRLNSHLNDSNDNELYTVNKDDYCEVKALCTGLVIYYRLDTSGRSTLSVLVDGIAPEKNALISQTGGKDVIGYTAYSGLPFGWHTFRFTSTSNYFATIDCFDIDGVLIADINNTAMSVSPTINISPMDQAYYFDFAGKIAGSPTNNKNDVFRSQFSTTPAPGSTDWLSYTGLQADIDSLKCIDGSLMIKDFTPTDGIKAGFLYAFDLTPINSNNAVIKDNLRQINVKWYGFGQGYNSDSNCFNNRVDLKIWNVRTSAYDNLISTSGQSEFGFSRNSTAYGYSSKQYNAEQFRIETQGGKKGILVEESTNNLVESSQIKFTNMVIESGTTATITQDQVVSEWNATDATRIQSSGGSLLRKCRITISNYNPIPNGVTICSSVWVKNIGTTAVTVRINDASSTYTVVNPGENKLCTSLMTGNGVYGAYLAFYTANVDDSLDIIAWHPQVEAKPYNTTWTESSRSPESISIPQGLPNTDPVVWENTRNLLKWGQATGESLNDVMNMDGSIITLATEEAWQGLTSFKVDGTQSTVGSPAINFLTSLTSGKTYTFSFYVKGPAGRQISAMFRYYEPDIAVISPDFTLDGTWQRFSHTWACTSTQSLYRLRILTSSTNPFAIYVDGVQLEEGLTATDWVPPAIQTKGPHNLLTSNQSSVETDTTGFTALSGATIGKTGSPALVGQASLSVVTPGAVAKEGITIGSTTVTSGKSYTASAYVRGQKGNLPATFTRNSTATKLDGSAVLANQPRNEWGRFQNLLSKDLSDIEGSIGGFPPQGSTTLSKTTEKVYEGTYSLKAEVLTASVGYGVGTLMLPVSASRNYIFSLYIAGAVGGEVVSVQFNLFDKDGNYLDTVSATVTLTTAFQRIKVLRTNIRADATKAMLRAVTGNASAITFYTDAWQLEEALPGQTSPTAWRPGGTGKAIMIEEPTTNLISFTKQKFESWGNFDSSVVTLTQSQTVPEWGVTDATRIQATAGSGTAQLKFLIGLDTPLAGEVRTCSVWVKNIGTSTVRISNQLGAVPVLVSPGESKYCVCKGFTGNGFGVNQLRFEVTDATQGFDVIAWHPQSEAKAYATSFTDGTRAGEVAKVPNPCQLEEGTAELWFRLNDSISRSRNLLSIGGSNSSMERFELNVGFGNSLIGLLVGPGTVGEEWVSASFVPDTEWHHAAFTWGNFGTKLYVDGVRKNTGKKCPGVLGAYMFIGDFAGSLLFADSLIDSLRISNVARTDDEILAGYNSLKPFEYDDHTTYLNNFDDTLNGEYCGKARIELGSSSQEIWLNEQWQRLSATAITSSTSLAPTITTARQDAITFYLDCLMLQQSDHVEDWCAGGRRRNYGMNSGTVEMDVYVNATSKRQIVSVWPSIFTIARTGALEAVWLYHGSAGEPSWSLQSRKDGLYASVFSVLDSDTPDGWHNFAVTWNGTILNLYIDGIYKGKASLQNAQARIMTSLNLLTHSSAAHFANTICRNVRISQFAHSASEIAADYASGDRVWEQDTLWLNHFDTNKWIECADTTISTNLTDYVDASNKVSIVAQSKYPSTSIKPGAIAADYVKATVNHCYSKLGGDIITNRHKNIFTPQQASFESDDMTGISIYAQASIVRDTTYSYHGSSSLKITSSSLDSGIALNAHLAGGEQYTFSYYYRADSAIKVRGTVLHPTGAWDDYPSSVASTSWQRISHTFTAQRSGIFSFYIQVATTGGTIWVDGVQVEQGSTATTLEVVDYKVLNIPQYVEMHYGDNFKLNCDSRTATLTRASGSTETPAVTGLDTFTLVPGSNSILFDANNILVKFDDGEKQNVNSPRFVPSKFGTGILMEDGSTNIVSAEQLKFISIDDGLTMGWKTYGNPVITLTQNQVVPEWGATDATRIQSAGGTASLKYVLYLPGRKAGVTDIASMWIKNLGKCAVRLSGAWATNMPVNPGESKRVTSTIYDTSQTTRWYGLQVDDNTKDLDIIAWRPQVEEKAYATSWIDGTRLDDAFGVPVNVLKPEGTIELLKRMDISGQNKPVGIHRSIFWCTDGVWGLMWPNGSANYISFTSIYNSWATGPHASIAWDAGDWLYIAARWKRNNVSLTVTNITKGTTQTDSLASDALLPDTGYLSLGTGRGATSVTDGPVDFIRISDVYRSDGELQYSSPPVMDSNTVYLQNFEDSLAGVAPFTKSLTSNLSDYVTPDNKVHFLAMSKYPADGIHQSTVYEDYLKLEAKHAYASLGSRALVNSGSNLIENPGFESDFDAWEQSGSGVSISDGAYTGSKCLKIVGSGAWQVPRQKNWINVVGGNQYKASMMVKQIGGTLNDIYIQITWRLTNGNALGVDAVLAQYPTGEWVEVKKVLTAPVGAAWISFEIVGRDTFTGTAYIDNVMFTPDIDSEFMNDPEKTLSFSTLALNADDKVTIDTKAQVAQVTRSSGLIEPVTVTGLSNFSLAPGSNTILIPNNCRTDIKYSMPITSRPLEFTRNLIVSRALPQQNLLTYNQSTFEGGFEEYQWTTGIDITIDKTTSWHELASIRIVLNGSSDIVQADGISVLPYLPYTASAYVKGSGTLKFAVLEYNNDVYVGGTINIVSLTDIWTRISVSRQFANGNLAIVRFLGPTGQITTANIDGVMLEQSDTMSPWVPGGTGQLLIPRR